MKLELIFCIIWFGLSLCVLFGHGKYPILKFGKDILGSPIYITIEDLKEFFCSATIIIFLLKFLTGN